MAKLDKYKVPRGSSGGPAASPRYQGMAQDFIDGARGNSFGRPVIVEYDGPGKFAALQQFGLTKVAAGLPLMPDLKGAFTRGSQAALNKFKGLSDHSLELGGLGMLAAPVAHDLVTEEDKTKSLMEMGGLGVLAIPSLRHLRKP